MAVCSLKGREMHAGSRVGGGVEKKEEGTVEEGTEQNRGPPPTSPLLSADPELLMPRSGEDFIRCLDLLQLRASLGVSASQRINSHLAGLSSSRRLFMIRQVEILGESGQSSARKHPSTCTHTCTLMHIFLNFIEV